ncbi:hypothetical protein ABPG74_010206 [Tetrahymena malaccensis]
MDVKDTTSTQQTTEEKPKSQLLQCCSTIGCGKPASMHCPTCVKLGLAPSYFCNQDCFKTFWPIHKLFHKKQEEQAVAKSKFNYTGTLRPGKISPRLYVPEHIKKPDYASSGIPNEEINSKFTNKVIEVKSFEDIEKMRKVSLLGRQALDLGHSLVRPGITTDEIDKAVHQFIIENDAYPSPLNYHNFPKSICTSVNEVICHGIPDDRPLEEGDIVNLDISLYKFGYHTDLNETYHVGKVAESSAYLVEHSYRCLEEAIKICKPGTMYRDVGNIIGKYIHERGLEINRTYCGHGIGNLFHIMPTIPHYPKNKAPNFMKVGHVFTIEPMINQGTHQDVLWPDDWTAVTADGQRSSQFEHTLVITEGGYEILTSRLSTSPALDFNVGIL